MNVELTPTETAPWIRTVTVPLFLWLGFSLFALGVVLLGAAIGGDDGASALFSGVVMLVVTLPVLAFGRMRINVDWRGLKVVTWIMGISLKTIPLDAPETPAALLALLSAPR